MTLARGRALGERALPRGMIQVNAPGELAIPSSRDFFCFIFTFLFFLQSFYMKLLYS